MEVYIDYRGEGGCWVTWQGGGGDGDCDNL